MLLYILLTVLAGILVIISLVFTIFGLLRRKKKLALSSLAACMFFSLAGGACLYNCLRKSVDYITGDKFQAATKKGAEQIGKTWGSTVSGVSKGVSETLDENAIAALANKSAVITGKMIKATAAGYDSSAGKLMVLTDKSVADAGLAIGRAEQNVGKTAKNIGLFINFSRQYSGKLKLTLYDQQGNKTDDAEVSVDMQARTERVIVFDFQYLLPDVNGYCILTTYE